MEFGLNKVSQLSGIQNNAPIFFSFQDKFCDSKIAYAKKKNKNKKKVQAKFNAFTELESVLFSEEEDEKKETDKYNELTHRATHQAADNVGSIATRLAGNAAAKIAVGKKHGLFAGYRTRKARKAYAKNFGRKYGSSINSLAHAGADYAHEKYIKE